VIPLSFPKTIGDAFFALSKEYGSYLPRSINESKTNRKPIIKRKKILPFGACQEVDAARSASQEGWKEKAGFFKTGSGAGRSSDDSFTLPSVALGMQ
jgi:hypothetical protein